MGAATGGTGGTRPPSLKMEGGRPPQIVTLTVQCYFRVIGIKTWSLNQRVALEGRAIRTSWKRIVTLKKKFHQDFTDGLMVSDGFF